MAASTITEAWSSLWSAGPQVSKSQSAVKQRMDRDAQLVAECLGGNDVAWEDLVRTHSRLVYASCYRFTSRPETSLDLTQEVFIRVFRSLHTFDPASGGFRTWLMRLTRNLLIDDYRKNKKHQIVDPLEDKIAVLEQRSGIGGQADRTLRAREATDLLQLALSKLSPELREAVVLRDLQEMEYREIAGTLEVPEGTVKSRINRGRRELAKQLRALGYEA